MEKNVKQAVLAWNGERFLSTCILVQAVAANGGMWDTEEMIAASQHNRRILESLRKDLNNRVNRTDIEDALTGDQFFTAERALSDSYDAAIKEGLSKEPANAEPFWNLQQIESFLNHSEKYCS